MLRLSKQRAVHVCVTAGLEHQHAAQPILVLSRPFAPLEHRAPLRRGPTLDDEPERLTGGVRVNRA